MHKNITHHWHAEHRLLHKEQPEQKPLEHFSISENGKAPKRYSSKERNEINDRLLKTMTEMRDRAKGNEGLLDIYRTFRKLYNEKRKELLTTKKHERKFLNRCGCVEKQTFWRKASHKEQVESVALIINKYVDSMNATELQTQAFAMTDKGYEALDAGEHYKARAILSKAIKLFEQANALEKNTDRLYNIALLHINLEQPDLAEDAFARALEFQPDAAGVYIQRANMRRKLGVNDPEKEMQAVEDYRAARDIYTDRINRVRDGDPSITDPLPRLFQRRGQVRHNMGDYISAIDDYSVVIDQGAAPMEVFIDRANCYLYTEQHEKAIADYTTVINQAQRVTADMFQNRGACFLKLKRYKEAYEDLSVVVSADPKNVQARKGLADSLRGLGRFDEAFTEFTRCYELNSNDTEPIWGRIWCLQGNNKYAEALEDVKFLMKARPKDGSVLAEYGKILGKLGRTDEAIKILEYLETNGTHADIQEKLSELYRERNGKEDTEKSIQALQKASGGYGKQKRFEKAFKVLDSLKKIAPSDPLTHYQTAWISARAQFGADAIDSYEECIALITKGMKEKDPTVLKVMKDFPTLLSDSYFEVANIHQGMGHVEDAMTNYEHCIDQKQEKKVQMAKEQIAFIKSTFHRKSYFNPEEALSEMQALVGDVSIEALDGGRFSIHTNASYDQIATLAVCFAANGQFSTAVALMELALERTPNQNANIDRFKDWLHKFREEKPILNEEFIPGPSVFDDPNSAGV